MEDRLQRGLQQHRRRRLGDPVGRVRHTQHPDSGPMIFRYLHRPHRSREIASRAHPIPQLVEVIPLRRREPLDADRVHTRRPTVGPNLLPRPIDEAFVDLKRLHLRLRSHPRLLPHGIDSHRVDLKLAVDCPAPSLQPHYRAFIATTNRSAPVPRIGTLPLTAITACGPPSRDQRANLTHFRSSLSGRQVLLFHTSACDELTPPIHRAPPRPHAGRSPAEGAPRRARLCFGPPHTVRFRCRRCLFRCVSSGSHTFVFSSHTCPATYGTSTATLTTPALNRRSLRWFGISACTANPEGPPPSLVPRRPTSRPRLRWPVRSASSRRCGPTRHEVTDQPCRNLA